MPDKTVLIVGSSARSPTTAHLSLALRDQGHIVMHVDDLDEPPPTATAAELRAALDNHFLCEEEHQLDHQRIAELGDWHPPRSMGYRTERQAEHVTRDTVAILSMAVALGGGLPPLPSMPWRGLRAPRRKHWWNLSPDKQHWTCRYCVCSTTNTVMGRAMLLHPTTHEQRFCERSMER